MLFLRPRRCGRMLTNYKNMKKTLIYCSVFALLFVACQNDPKDAGSQVANNFASPVVLAGHWIDLDFCSRANQFGSVLAAMNNAHLPYAYAISFDPNRPDSVICHNGLETWTLQAKFKDDTLELVGARKGKSIFLVYNSQGEKNITMFDGTTGTMQMDQFIKSAANARDGYTAFSTALNHNLFSGVFIAQGNSAGKEPIQFTPGGFILNWGDFDRYEVCTAGDCFVVGNEIDVITLSKSKVENSERLLGFKYNGTNDTLRLYNLANPNPDEKSAYEVKGVAYTFLRKSAEK